MISPEYLKQLYTYNQWANHKVLLAAASLTDEQLHRSQGHSWGSVFSVLLHMMSAEWIWLSRWKGTSPKAPLSPEAFPTLTVLQTHWSLQQAELVEFVAAQTIESLMRPVPYTTTRGKTNRLVLWQMIVHLANHGTHHRGELAAMFALMNIPHEEEDWLRFFLESSGQA